MSVRVPMPNVIRCTLCQQILYVDVLATGVDGEELVRKTAKHYAAKHPEEQL